MPHPERTTRPRRAPASRSLRTTSALTDRQRELLQVVRVQHNAARFASSERIPDWGALKEVMMALGGTWKRQSQSFVFPSEIDASERVETAIATGCVYDPRAAGFFETPSSLARDVVEAVAPTPGDTFLEPEAGRGAIADVVWEWLLRVECPDPHRHLLLVEALDDNRRALLRKPYASTLSPVPDFLSLEPDAFGRVDCIPMNPPFARGADIDHVTHATRFLRAGGRLAAIMSAGVTFRRDRKAIAFRELVEAHEGQIAPLPEGSFRASGTDVSTVLVTLTRRE